MVIHIPAADAVKNRHTLQADRVKLTVLIPDQDFARSVGTCGVAEPLEIQDW